MADGLSTILKNKVATGENTPVKICRRALGIPHLLFADDTLLFFEASRDQSECVKAAIEEYGAAIG